MRELVKHDDGVAAPLAGVDDDLRARGMGFKPSVEAAQGIDVLPQTPIQHEHVDRYERLHLGALEDSLCSLEVQLDIRRDLLCLSCIHGTDDSNPTGCRLMPLMLGVRTRSVCRSE